MPNICVCLCLGFRLESLKPEPERDSQQKPPPPSIYLVVHLRGKMASVAPSRLAALTRLRCSVFGTSYNPTSQRTGAKYLRRRLQGPSMLKYYPLEASFAALNRANPEWKLIDQDEQQRLQDIEDRKKRGKGTPKKSTAKGDSRRTQRKR
ncbi:hypothetical protein FA95DRAFT_1607440 [Auriscalpium vulgare]|uniref:Uncharacterized protein n=1 Tax=Auriscalpium vulgare TaxID=40419 RepID=A0ACB8RQJ3_9AGAM|nr:hypothetical protein FA95DRAFT_1607440 [Auriscalpium vulgare]